MTILRFLYYCIVPKVVNVVCSFLMLFDSDNEPFSLDQAKALASSPDFAPPDLFATTLRMLLALGSVLILVLVVYHIAKRYTKTKGKIFPGEKGIKILSSKHLGYKRSIMAIEYEGKKMLLGVTPNTISHLSDISSDTNNDKNV